MPPQTKNVDELFYDVLFIEEGKNTDGNVLHKKAIAHKIGQKVPQ